MCGQKCQEGLLIRLYSLSLLLCFSLSLFCPYPLSFLTSSPHLPSSSTPEAGGHQPGAAFAVGLKERRQRMRPGLRSVSHTHTHTLAVIWGASLSLYHPLSLSSGQYHTLTHCHSGASLSLYHPLSLLRSVSHTHSLSFGGRPCHYITPSLSSVLHSKPPPEGCPCYYNTLSLRLGSQYVLMP